MKKAKLFLAIAVTGLLLTAFGIAKAQYTGGVPDTTIADKGKITVSANDVLNGTEKSTTDSLTALQVKLTDPELKQLIENAATAVQAEHDNTVKGWTGWGVSILLAALALYSFFRRDQKEAARTGAGN
jgi:hypothetical protein